MDDFLEEYERNFKEELSHPKVSLMDEIRKHGEGLSDQKSLSSLDGMAYRENFKENKDRRGFMSTCSYEKAL